MLSAAKEIPFRGKLFVLVLCLILLIKEQFLIVFKSDAFAAHKHLSEVNKNFTKKHSNKCLPGPNLVGPVGLDESDVKNMGDLENILSANKEGFVQHGGWYKPKDCEPVRKVAILIPYRNRPEQLKIYLRHIHPILKRQRLHYRVIVVEQVGEDPFCRGTLFNIGYAEAIKMLDFDCFVFSDVDLLPENDRNYYGCPTSPRHMSAAIDIFNYAMINQALFGGVSAFLRSDFENVNGFSNLFFGWGGEDDDLYKRIMKKGYRLTRPSMKVGRYKMIKKNHFRSTGAYPERWKLLETSAERMPQDGLNSLKYNLKQIVEEPLVTFVKIELKKSMYGLKD